VKPLSQYVTGQRPRVSTRIVLKGVADAGGKAVTLVITAVAARTLVSDAFGVMALAMGTGWLLGVATDAGLSMYLARETARQRGRARALLSEVMVLRAGLAYFAAAMVTLFVGRLVPPHWKLQFVLVVLAQLTAAVLETVAHYFRGLERSDIESAIHLSQRGLTLVLSLMVLWWWPRLDLLGAAMLAPVVIALVVAVALAWNLSGDGSRKPGVEVQWAAPADSRLPTPDSRPLTPRRFLSDVVPLGLGVLLSALYFRIDIFFIERWHGLEAVGGYNAVFRLVEASRLLPAAVLAVTFPLLVNATHIGLVQRIGGWLALAGGGVALIAFAGAHAIVTAIYGVPYGYTAPAFAVLALALPLFFLNYALTHQVIGWDGQRAYLMIAVAALCANVAANVILVPSRGIVGAAIATLITELVVTAGCLVALRAQTHAATAASKAASHAV
jgi:O-antigen/teichoic acid export membrane protein